MPASSTDYERVERAIAFIAERARNQPSLAEIAGHVGLSEFHFQRLFTRWAGITPKRFAQYVSIEHAKTLLTRSRSLLDATYSAGLSSPGRLHDLFVTVEAMTPGEYRASGSGVAIRYGTHASPFGDTLVALTERGICAIHFVDAYAGGEAAVLRDLRRQWPGATFVRDARAGREYAAQMFAHDSGASAQPIPILLKGTNFQVNVWKALLRIPAASAITYEELAELAGVPKAVRAAGTAIGKNPLSYLVPCHRVIRKTGDFGNYGGGVERKRAILAWESGRFIDQP